MAAAAEFMLLQVWVRRLPRLLQSPSAVRVGIKVPAVAWLANLPPRLEVLTWTVDLIRGIRSYCHDKQVNLP